MEAVPHLVHAGIELLSCFSRAMHDAAAELSRVMSDCRAKVARVVADSRRSGPPRATVRLAGQNRCGHGE